MMTASNANIPDRNLLNASLSTMFKTVKGDMVKSKVMNINRPVFYSPPVKVERKQEDHPEIGNRVQGRLKNVQAYIVNSKCGCRPCDIKK